MDFGEILIGCLVSFKAGVITKALDDVILEHVTLYLRFHEGYDPRP